MTPFSKTPKKKLAQARDMFTDDEMKISDPKAVATAADLAAENARLQKETDDVLDYYTGTVEKLQAENMRLREACLTTLETLSIHGLEDGNTAATIRAALAGGE